MYEVRPVAGGEPRVVNRRDLVPVEQLPSSMVAEAGDDWRPASSDSDSRGDDSDDVDDRTIVWPSSLCQHSGPPGPRHR